MFRRSEEGDVLGDIHWFIGFFGMDGKNGGERIRGLEGERIRRLER